MFWRSINARWRHEIDDGGSSGGVRADHEREIIINYLIYFNFYDKLGVGDTLPSTENVLVNPPRGLVMLW